MEKKFDWHCKHCGNKWNGRKYKKVEGGPKPKVCGACKSPYWETEPTEKRKTMVKV